MKFLRTLISKFTPESKINRAEHETIMRAVHKLGKFDYINFGGCGVAALALYRYMLKQGIANESTCFKFMYSGPKRECSIPYVPIHVALYHNGRYYDSYGVYEDYNLYRVRTTKDPECLLKSINDYRDNWNSRFDRRKECRQIAWSLGVSLKDVKR